MSVARRELAKRLVVHFATARFGHTASFDFANRNGLKLLVYIRAFISASISRSGYRAVSVEPKCN